MITIPELVQTTDTYEIWRQKTNQAVDAIGEIALLVTEKSSLENQFALSPSPLSGNEIQIKSGKLRNRNVVHTIPDSGVTVSSGLSETLIGDGSTQNFNIGYSVVDNDPDVAVYIDNVLQTSGYTISAPDQISFTGYPANGAKISVLKKTSQVLFLDGNLTTPVVNVSNTQTLMVNNVVPIYKVMSIEIQGFTGYNFLVWDNLIQNGAKISSIVEWDGLVETPVPSEDYSVSGTGIITFDALLNGKTIRIYGVEEDLRTWAVAAVDPFTDDSNPKIEWATTLLSPQSVILTGISDTNIGDISVYVDGYRKTDATGANDYTVASSGGFVELTFGSPLPTNTKVMVVAHQDDHPILVQPIAVDFPANPTPTDTFSLTSTVMEGLIFPGTEKYIAVYVGGARQSISSYTTSTDTVVLDTPVANTDVMFVINEPNALDGALTFGGNSGSVGDIPFRTTGSIEWRAPEFDASVITSGIISFSQIPTATTKEVLVGAETQKAVIPRDASLLLGRESFGRWSRREVGCHDDFMLTNMSTYPDSTGKHYVATRCGRIYAGLNGTTGFDSAFVQNSPFAPVYSISHTHDDANLSYQCYVVGGIGNFATFYPPYSTWNTYKISDFASLTSSGMDNTWKCIQIESFLRLDGGNHAYAIVFENKAGDAWRLCTFNVGFSGLPNNYVTLTFAMMLEASPAVKPVIKSHIFKAFGRSSTMRRLDWFVGNTYKYYLGSYSSLVTHTLSATIPGEKVIDYVTWDTNNGVGGAIAPNGEGAGANGTGVSYGALLTDKGTISISAQSNSSGTPWFVNGTIFSDSVMDETTYGVCESPLKLGVVYDTNTNTELGRRIVGLSEISFPVTSTTDSTDSSYGIERVGSAISRPSANMLIPTYSQLFLGTGTYHTSFVQNTQAGISRVIPDAGFNAVTKHTIAFTGETKAFSTTNSPAPPIAIKKIISNGATKLAVAAKPINMVWVLDETDQGGNAVPIDDNIIDAFCEDSAGGKLFFIITETRIMYSVDGYIWMKTTPHGVNTLSGGNGVYEMSCASEDYSIPSPSTRYHFVAIVNGTLLVSRDNPSSPITPINNFSVLSAGTYKEITANPTNDVMFFLTNSGNVMKKTYNELSSTSTPTLPMSLSSSYTTTVVDAMQFSHPKQETVIIDNSGQVLSHNGISWVPTSGLTLNGESAVGISGVTKLAGRFFLAAKTSSGRMYASPDGIAWFDFFPPMDNRNTIGNISCASTSIFLTETAINITTGRLPAYYKVVT